jgi:hypothetical protein
MLVMPDHNRSESGEKSVVFVVLEPKIIPINWRRCDVFILSARYIVAA